MYLPVGIMLSGTVGPSKGKTLMGEYSALLAHSALRHRAWLAENAACLEAQLASKVKSEFISNMSHELRTPLNTVIGFAKLLGEHHKRRLNDAEITEYADLIHDAAKHLLAVINDILDISQMQSGTYALDACEVDIEEILRGVLGSYKLNAIEMGVLLDSRFDPALPAVKGDPAKLTQVFSNLVGNAIKFTQRGGRVTLEARPQPSNGVAVYVRDTGLGMTEEEVAVALTPFAQVDAGHSRWRDGVGLGLPIARALVQLHGGSIEIHSAKALGTEVAVMLPSSHQVSLTDPANAALRENGVG
jgi:two-component system cell cycle sensor histidine kinase PleC